MYLWNVYISEKSGNTSFASEKVSFPLFDQSQYKLKIGMKKTIDFLSIVLRIWRCFVCTIFSPTRIYNKTFKKMYFIRL